MKECNDYVSHKVYVCKIRALIKLGTNVYMDKDERPPFLTIVGSCTLYLFLYFYSLFLTL